jgi:hypothetical protein
MLEFVERTGVGTGARGRRYLWTDAFAVCNLFALDRADLALALIDDVHHVLGRQRQDQGQSGWLSGLSEAEGEAHPTRGGLRIGKPLPERRPGEPFDEELEWERDGQYFHYLTRWMHALEQASGHTGDERFNLWARELAEAAFAGFAYTDRAGGRPRLAWKMSCDLTRPLVASMGHHDPLDGFITCVELQRSGASGPSLDPELEGFASMLEGVDWATSDALGIGGLLMDACRVEQLTGRSAIGSDALLAALLLAALEGTRHRALRSDPHAPASRRLAFRELGLAIGFAGLERMGRTVDAEPERFAHRSEIVALLGALGRHASVAAAIEAFWSAPEHRLGPTYLGHRDINDVMLATLLLPDGVLVLAPANRPAVRISSTND